MRLARQRIGFWPPKRWPAIFWGGILVTVIFLLSLTACGQAAEATPTPPQVHYGEDICKFCGMIVSESRYAAAYVIKDGHSHLFDDIGDMVQLHLRQPEEAVAFFVHDYETEAWMRAETAYFVHSETLPTPMLSGLAAFTTEERAKTLAAELDGQILTFEELLMYYRENKSN